VTSLQRCIEHQSAANNIHSFINSFQEHEHFQVQCTCTQHTHSVCSLDQRGQNGTYNGLVKHTHRNTDQRTTLWHIGRPAAVRLWKQEIWANAHETRDSISLISYVGCLGLSPVYVSENSLASQPKIAKKSLNTHTFGGSRSFMVIDVGTTGKLVSSACYDAQQVCVYLQPFSR